MSGFAGMQRRLSVRNMCDMICLMKEVSLQCTSLRKGPAVSEICQLFPSSQSSRFANTGRVCGFEAEIPEIRNGNWSFDVRFMRECVGCGVCASCGHAEQQAKRDDCEEGNN